MQLRIPLTIRLMGRQISITRLAGWLLMVGLTAWLMCESRQQRQIEREQQQEKVLFVDMEATE